MINYRQLFLSHLAQTSDAPLLLEVVRAAGVKLYKPDGSYCIDVISGISVSNLGHCHEKVVSAIKQQADLYAHLMVYGEVIQAPQLQLANLLLSLLPSKYDNVYFVNSGSEAVEAALKLAKRATGRFEIISCMNAYHGSSTGALSVMGSESFKNAFRPLLPGIKHIEYNSIPDLELITNKTACVIIEPIQGEAGIVVPDNAYLQKLRLKCDEQGVILIFDEIQTGFGRTGRLFGYEHSGVLPDVFLFAKALGAGLPLGAVVGPKVLMNSFSNNPVLGHITTFGGNPLCCAASYAMLKELTDNKSIIASVPEKEVYIRTNLKHPLIKQIKGVGLFLAVVLDKKINLYKLIFEILNEGVLIDFFLFNDNCLRLAPPLIITEEEVAEAIAIILRVLDRHM
ncbi:MAG: aspartate aminotransferase family protein [Bacteroidales bacterium]|nr:aspartate aminotransferase family protein [Bacteroidales bacterium]